MRRIITTLSDGQLIKPEYAYKKQPEDIMKLYRHNLNQERHTPCGHYKLDIDYLEHLFQQTANVYQRASNIETFPSCDPGVARKLLEAQHALESAASLLSDIIEIPDVDKSMMCRDHTQTTLYQIHDRSPPTTFGFGALMGNQWSDIPIEWIECTCRHQFGPDVDDIIVPETSTSTTIRRYFYLPDILKMLDDIGTTTESLTVLSHAVQLPCTKEAIQSLQDHEDRSTIKGISYYPHWTINMYIDQQTAERILSLYGAERALEWIQDLTPQGSGHINPLIVK
jgi:hypothetical protein